ncbi:hypothetical protein C1N27_14205 [Vibrio diazotrophicus]|nr:hypothetical protein C1N27_14205 [Vibrio diazotrophicus]
MRDKAIFEWNHELTDKNLIYHNDQIIPLHNLADDRKMDLLLDIIPSTRIHNEQKWKTKMYKARCALKKSTATLTSEGCGDAAALIEVLLTDKRNYISEFDQEWIVREFDDCSMPRKQQRVKQIKTYIEALNLLNDAAPKTATFVQEGIFKIPRQWKVGTDVISLKEYILFMKKFLTSHFPDYPIKAIVGHDDERSENENIGAHIHYYLSARNEKSRFYDLRKSQIRVINEYLKKKHPTVDPLPEDGDLQYKETGAMGSYFQQMFQDYANEHLLNSKGLHAEFTDDTEKAQERYQHMIRESKLPKNKRSFNFHTKQLEDLVDKIKLAEEKQSYIVLEQAALDELEQEKQNKIAHINELREGINLGEKAVKSVLLQIEIEEERLTSIKQDVQKTIEDAEQETFLLKTVRKQRQDEQAQLEHTRNLQNEVNQRDRDLVQQLLRASFLASYEKAQNSSRRDGLTSFIGKVVDKLNKALPEPLQQLISSVISVLDDNGIKVKKNTTANQNVMTR